jgi:hypothetical protein
MTSILAIPALLLSLGAFAADFTFNVPVNLQDYQQPSTYVGSSQSIWCTVIAGTAEIGRGHTPLAIPASGNYNATVSVAVTLRAGTHASDATGYRCWLSVSDDVTAASAVSSGALKARPGTTPVLLVYGYLTH